MPKSKPRIFSLLVRNLGSNQRNCSGFPYTVKRFEPGYESFVVSDEYREDASFGTGHVKLTSLEPTRKRNDLFPQSKRVCLHIVMWKSECWAVSPKGSIEASKVSITIIEFDHDNEDQLPDRKSCLVVC